MRLILVCSLLLISTSLSARIVFSTKSEGQPFQVEELVKVSDIPWGMDFLSADQIIFTEKEGKLKLLNLKTKKVSEISGAPEVTYKGQGGLLDVKKDPSSDWIYLTYSKRIEQTIVTHLGRGKIEGNKLTNWKVLLQTKVKSSKGVHFGSRVAFSGDYVFFWNGGSRNTRNRSGFK